jgi:hypothetical protein
VPLPPDEMLLSEQYWRIFGGPPEASLMEFCGELLRQGVDVEVIERSLRNLPMALQRAKSTHSASWFEWHGHRLPFRVLERPEARALVVTLPGLLIDEEPPAQSLPPGVDCPAHVLSIGMATPIPCRYGDWQDWADAAAELIVREADGLGVERQAIVCYGASIQGTRALMVGTRAAVGTIVVGAPDVKVGTWFATLATWTANNVCTHPAFARMYEWCGIGGGEATIAALDRMVIDSCLHAPVTRVVGIVSPGDLFYADVQALVSEARASPTGTPIAIDYLDYGEHDNVFPPFWQRLNEELQRLTAL